MAKTLVLLFRISLVSMLLSGSMLVMNQLLGILLGNGDWVILSSDLFAKPTFILSAITGLIGFALSYLPREM
ncbi:hypothetical protein [Ammoniphilus sp. CFH 90114]|uniref:hypothetical protein n=1 Tax=Ammoniphilus sp. CFH 90114 TaxID=2493665 RepID=UPI00100E15BC|nr:hypothetical protein [Ammoniphilus sp. CFH 90114]RXT03926.1 hypothetical protein EIZ39_22485 [Ammoniphilus sp. CFH 90114]